MSDDLIREPYSTAERVVSIRMCEALERIAAALERTADADPLTMLSAVMGEGDAPAAIDLPGVPPGADLMEPRKPIASNGYTVIYAHPDNGWHVVLRRDKGAESGFVASIERVE